MNPKTFVLVGQYATGCVFGAIGLTWRYEQHHRNLIMGLMILNGVCQSSGWPGLVNIVDNWFGDHRYKIVIMGTCTHLFVGVYAACLNVGNLVGDLIYGLEMGHTEHHVPLSDFNAYMWPIYSAALYMFAWCTINLIVLRPFVEEDESLVQ